VNRSTMARAQARVGEGLGPSGEGFVGGDRDAVAFFALGQDLEEAKSSRGGWLVGART
jgi:hypothetical protein